MSSPWSSGADPKAIWNSNSPNLNILRRYSLRSSSMAASSSSSSHQPGVSIATQADLHSLLPNMNQSKSTCSWEPSSDNKYLIGYIVIHRQDLVTDYATLGFSICGGKPTHDGQYGAIVEHVVPGSVMNLICKMKVGDEIVEWNGFNLRNKRHDEVSEIIKSVKNANSLRLVAIRQLNNNNSVNNSNNNSRSSTSPGGSGVSSVVGNNNKNTDVTS